MTTTAPIFLRENKTTPGLLPKAMKPILILDNHFRTRDELFRGEVFENLADLCDMPLSTMKAHLSAAKRWIRKRLSDRTQS